MHCSNYSTYLAFDLGASSCRAVLGRLEGDAMRMEELSRFDTPIIENDGRLFWDVDGIWDELQRSFRLALEALPDLRSVSVDSWAVDYVPLGEAGRPLRRPYCYRDTRTDGVMRRAFEIATAEEIYAATGIQFLPFNTLFQLLADPAGERGRVHQYVTIADYLNYRFSGRAAVEVSMASTTQLMDVRAKQWARPLLDKFGLDGSAWPEIVPSGTRLGPVMDSPHVETVASCSHDTGSAVAAAPAVTSGSEWAYISCGTWSLLGIERTEPLLSDAARKAGFTNEAGIDGTIRFLKNLTGLWALQECAREWGDVDWDELEIEARAAAPHVARIDLEHPRFIPRGRMEERLFEYCREHGEELPRTRGQLARVILESIAESYRMALADMERVTGARCATIHLFGGGSQNALLCELTSDACERTVVAGPAEAAALGNLLIQARTMSDLPPGVSIRQAAARSSDLKIYEPHVRNATRTPNY